MIRDTTNKGLALNINQAGEAMNTKKRGQWNLRQSTLTAFFAGLVVSLAAPAWAVDPAVLEAEKKRVEVVEKVAPTVVAIFGPGGGGGGSGVVISKDGYVLTNFHVTKGAGDYMQCGLNDGKLYDAVVVGIDPTGDVAMIKLLGRNDFPIATMGDSDKLKAGDWSFAMGNPFLLATDFRPTVTFGIISGVHRYQYPAGTILEYTDCIQTDTSINPGNSGGPLFNIKGELVGINGRGSFEKRGRVNSGAGYAISINQIKHFMEHLKSGRIVDHATLGATVTSRGDGAVVIANILEESEAYRRGLRADDELVSFAGRPIRSVNQFKNILGIYPKGWKLPLVYRRDGEKTTIYPRLRALHHKSEFAAKKPKAQPKPQIPPKGKPGEKPKLPIPQMGRPKPKLPEKYKHMLVKKSGFANHYFNQLEQDRTLKALKEQGDFSKADGTWTLTGKHSAGGSISATITNTNVDFKLGKADFKQDLESGDFENIPPGSGGLLTALAHMRRMFALRDKFTEFAYLGSEPLDGQGEKVDVIVAMQTNVHSRWYFDRESGQLLGFDTQIAENEDDCEIRFTAWKDFEGRKLPSEMTITSGGVAFGNITIDSAELKPAN